MIAPEDSEDLWYARVCRGGSGLCGFVFSVGFLLSSTAWASGSHLSYTGTLAGPESYAEFGFILPIPTTVTFQTRGFGREPTPLAASSISPGGFVPLSHSSRGSGASASAFSPRMAPASPWRTAILCLILLTPLSETARLPGLVLIGINSDCGDDFMHYSLAAGTYSLVLSDADYQPEAVLNGGGVVFPMDLSTSRPGCSRPPMSGWELYHPQRQLRSGHCICRGGPYSALPSRESRTLIGLTLVLAGLKQTRKTVRMPPHRKDTTNRRHGDCPGGIRLT